MNRRIGLRRPPDAFFGARRFAAQNPGARILIGCSGRGDKDMPILEKTLMKDLR